MEVERERQRELHLLPKCSLTNSLANETGCCAAPLLDNLCDNPNLCDRKISFLVRHQYIFYAVVRRKSWRARAATERFEHRFDPRTAGLR